jgi:hypothetical protein
MKQVLVVVVDQQDENGFLLRAGYGIVRRSSGIVGGRSQRKGFCVSNLLEMGRMLIKYGLLFTLNSNMTLTNANKMFKFGVLITFKQ